MGRLPHYRDEQADRSRADRACCPAEHQALAGPRQLSTRPALRNQELQSENGASFMSVLGTSKRSLGRVVTTIAFTGVVVGAAFVPAAGQAATTTTARAAHGATAAATPQANPTTHWTFVRAYPDTSAGRKSAEAAGKALVAKGTALSYLLWSEILYSGRWNLWIEVRGKA